MAELADALGLNPRVERRAGSSPAPGTEKCGCWTSAWKWAERCGPLHSPIRVAKYRELMAGRRVAGVVTACAVTCGMVVAPASAYPDNAEVLGLVVSRETGTTAAQAERIVEAAVGEQVTRTPVLAGITAFALPGRGAAEAAQLASEIESVDGIAEAALDTRAHPDAIPNDPQFASQWSLTDPVSGIAASAAWDLTTGTGAVIAVIDSGITTHEEFTGKILPGYDFVSDPLVANDGDGRDPDPADPGDWVQTGDLTTHPDTFAGCARQDSSWHGTHVAGLAAATQNNARGISGAAPSASILPVRALGKCGGQMSDIAAAITWASGGSVAGVPANVHPADVINLSLSSSVTCQPFVQAAIDDAVSRGSVVVASAGNSFEPFTASSPGGCYDVITVGAVTRDGARAAYSNYGVPGRDLLVYAGGGKTGEAISSAVNAGATTPTAQADHYAPYAGTSMAAPLVAGAAALLSSVTTWSPLAIGEHLRDTARPASCPGGCAGIVDVNSALRTQPQVPSAVQNLRATAGDGALSLSWDPPTDSGSAPVTSYQTEYRINGGTWVPALNVWTSTLTRKVIIGLNNGVGYQARVVAGNVFGPGLPTESAVITPTGLPAPVRIGSVKYPTKTSAKVSLRLPAQPLTGVQYRLATAEAPEPAWTDAAARSTLRLALGKGIRYSLQVRGLNEVGASQTDAMAVATPVKPSAVRGLKAKQVGKKVVVRWTAPKRTGLRVTYQVRVNGGPIRRTRTTEARLRGVPAGRIPISVQAKNETGLGPVKTILKRK